MDAANIFDQTTAVLWRGMQCDPHIDALMFEFKWWHLSNGCVNARFIPWVEGLLTHAIILYRYNFGGAVRMATYAGVLFSRKHC